MDIAQAVTTFAVGAAGCLSMAKLLQMMERRRQALDKHRDSDMPAPAPLFPNGERENVIKEINRLRAENLERSKENAELRVDMQGLGQDMNDVKRALIDVSARLKHAGI